MPAFVIFLAIHVIFVPSTGKHISHSKIISNDIKLPLSIKPLEYAIILLELGFTNPSTKHFPSKLKITLFSSVSLIFLPIFVIDKVTFLVIKPLE